MDRSINNEDDPQHEETRREETKPNERNTFFECNICFDAVNEPVLTTCGHLYW